MHLRQIIMSHYHLRNMQPLLVTTSIVFSRNLTTYFSITFPKLGEPLSKAFFMTMPPRQTKVFQCAMLWNMAAAFLIMENSGLHLTQNNHQSLFLVTMYVLGSMKTSV
mmetsp:Transcript_15734/g.23131  ORF Transcript_15734/g.23131 Transcript_15734/m.23131 type:complete len:108 (-) Transcript_15734:746-1069(-)